jgi:hypothetical protein
MLALIISTTAFSAQFSIVRMNGKILVNGTKLDKKNEIIVGDTIEALGKKSFIQLKTKSGSVFLIRNGKLILEKFNKKSSLVSLIKGKFYHFYNKKKSKRIFKVKTKTAVMGVRGTKYMIEVKPDKSYLCVCQGEVSAQLLTSSKIHSIKAGDDIFLSKNSTHKQKASDQMMSMVKDEFKAMGHPVLP